MLSRLNLRLLLGFCLLCNLAAGTALADSPLPFADYRTESWHLPQTPSVTAGPVGALFNPATWAMSDQSMMDFWWNDRSLAGGLDNYGLAFGRTLGFSFNTQTLGTRQDSYQIYDYQVGLSSGSRVGTFGLAYRWAHGETQRTPREKALAVGFIGRGSRFASFGASGIMSLESQNAQYVLDVGVRPLGRDWITLFADYTINSDASFFQSGTWGLGLEIRPIRGVQLGFKTREPLQGDDWDYAVMAGLTVSDLNASVLPRYNGSGDLTSTSYLLRSPAPGPGLELKNPLSFLQPETYYPINLENRVLTYQKYRYFDDTRVAWLDLMRFLDRLLEQMNDDPKMKGVALNLAGFRGRPSLLWEFRNKLQEFQAAGKEVVIHADRLGQGTYYLAAVADHLSLDPQGNLALPGLALSRSYLKGTLEKLGVGFQEHRYFKYKSAAETLARDSMSPADREQRQRVVDVIYDTFAQGATAARNLREGAYNEAVDDLGQLSPQEALDRGLIDAIGRWDDIGPWLKSERGSRLGSAAMFQPERRFYGQVWGPTLKIPVVYAVGECAMDSGIRGRATSRYLRQLAGDPDVVAVVLRADSPGGDPLPSDLVADAVRKLKKAGKPVIISQGDVAASGGYWISMDGSTILTTPLTLTGSIGVISGWVWDEGLAEKMGITADVVSKGRHADLYAQVNFPFLGSLPRRPMNEQELARAEKLIRGMYDDFLTAVAEGRDMEKDQVHEVAQGRVWMGEDAIRHGLCDELGGLGDALALARRQANIPHHRLVDYVEYPPRKLFAMPSLLPRFPSLGLINVGNLSADLEKMVAGFFSAGAPAVNQTAQPQLLPGLDLWDSAYIQQLGQQNGQPLMALPPDAVPSEWKSWQEGQ